MAETLYTLPKRWADLIDTAKWGINSPFESDNMSLLDMCETIDEEFDHPLEQWERDENISVEEFHFLEIDDWMAVAMYSNSRTKHLVEVIEW